MRKWFCLWLVCLPVLVFGQFTYVIDQTIPVNDPSGIPYLSPWGGGLNAAQYNTIDLNNDGREDLVLFDRMANKPITFLRDNDHYTHTPEYETLFPDLSNWLLLRDYNCDGKKDIFTGDVLGIRVFTNTTGSDGNLKWDQFFFFAQSGLPKSPVVLTKGFSGLINLQLQFDDLPSIADMDNDGDLDILTMHFQGQGSVEFHKNFSQERYGTCDSLEFERITQNWGDFKECLCGVIAFNGSECPPASGGRIEHAGGKVLLAYDFDHDLDQDLLFSEAECNNLLLLENQGDNVNPVFSTAVDFPETDPAIFSIFPAPFLADVDFDGRSDLIVIPNIYAKDLLTINLQQSNWFYKNAGTQEQPDYVLQGKDFLQHQMIDVGDNAVPAFFDIDGDGDLDMVLGQNNHTDQSNGSLTLYQNIGNATTPSFSFVTDNYLDFGSRLLYNIKPQFHDANRDGKTDLILTATSSTTHQTGLYTLINKGNSGADFSGQPLNEIVLDVLFTENVHMTDVDLDGLQDILIGKSNGSVQFWKNNGPQGSYNLSLEASTFLGLGPSVDRQSPAIFTADLDDDGQTDLILGDQYGQISVISNFRNVNQEAVLLSDLIFNPISGEYQPRNLGGRVWPTAANIFNSGKPAIIVGNILGGIQVLRNDSGNALPAAPAIDIYPNPLDRSTALNIRVDRFVTVQVISLLGQELTVPLSLSPDQLYTLSLPNLSSGLFILRILVNNQTFTRRVVIY
jgi:FG-GAP-like repeat